MINLKKGIDKDKNQTLVKQAEELESLKTIMRNKQSQDEERRELQTIRSQISGLNHQLTATQHKPETINDRQEDTNKR